jgi:hypothetical protein
MTFRRTFGIAVAVSAIAMFTGMVGAAARDSKPAGQAPSVAKLPRLQQLWTLPGFGRFEGASAGSVYYVVSNDGKFVHAIDVSQGRSVWQTPLSEPVAEYVHVRLHGGAVLLAYARGRSKDAVIAAVSSKDGRLAWSRVVACENPDFEGAGNKLFLVCRQEPIRPPSEYREIEPATGRTTIGVRVDKAAKLAPNGTLCGLGSYEGPMWCGRMVGDHVETIWSQPGEPFSGVTLAGDYVVEEANGGLSVHRVKDGQIAWKRAGRFRVGVQEKTGRVILVGQDSVEVAQLGDGRTLARFPLANRRGANVLTDGGLVVVDPWGPGSDPLLVIDGKLQARSVAKNITFVSQVVGDVLLSQNVGMSGFNRENAPLEAYSLVRFAAAESELDPYHQAVAVLERYPLPYQAHEALPALRPIPDAMASLEKIISSGAPGPISAAIAVAGLTGDPRFAGALRARLETVTEVPQTAEQWSVIVDTASALADLRSPDAAVALLAFWNRLGTKLTPPWRRAILKDFVASAVWKYGAHKDLVRCEDTTFPVERVEPDKAALGTASPGVAYVVDGSRRWAAICEARQDDDGNGKLQVVVMQHGDTGGDQLRPYLVLGAGKGAEIDDFVAADSGGRWVVTTKDMCVHLVDTATGKAVALRGADGRPGDAVSGDHRAVTFSPDGKSLLYIKTDGARSTVIQRDLRTGVERPIDPGPGELSRVFFDRSGRFVVMEVVAQDTDHDQLLALPRIATTMGSRRCRAPVSSASFFGQIGDKPIQRVAPIEGGAVRDAPVGPPLAPTPRSRPGYDLASGGHKATGRGDSLPLGPLRWKPSEKPTEP